MNRKGLFAGPMGLIFGGMMALAIVTGLSTRGQHIVKRANERCREVDRGSLAQCEAIIESWSQDERIEYIRDKLGPNCTIDFSDGSCI